MRLKCFMIHGLLTLNVAIELSELLLRIWKVPGLNLGPETGPAGKFRDTSSVFLHFLYNPYSLIAAAQSELVTVKLGNEPSGFVKEGEFVGQLNDSLASQDGLCPMERCCYGVISKNTC